MACLAEKQLAPHEELWSLESVSYCICEERRGI